MCFLRRERADLEAFCCGGTSRSSGASECRRREEEEEEVAAVSKMDMVNEEGASNSSTDCARRLSTKKGKK